MHSHCHLDGHNVIKRIFKVCGPYVFIFLTHTPIFNGMWAKLVIENKTLKKKLVSPMTLDNRQRLG